MKHFCICVKLKRPFDFTLALLAMFVFSPVWVLVILAIWLEDGRPVFYIQERVGKDCHIFKAIKFRTMGYKKSSSKFANFLRSTALDELPQILNILKGQMSFVGPRPLVQQELCVCEELKARTAVLPGLTGLAQLHASKDSPVMEKFQYDIAYIERQNILLDMALILKSVAVSISRRWDRLSKG
jgi:undecaprenyl phosphate N,N'-diacetylbacillosamine 1-phosphate transferase